MKFPTLQTPSANAVTGDEEQHVLFVALRIPESVITPKGNYLAVPLLAQLVELRLKAAGIHVLRTGGSGEFNNSRLSYAVGGNLGRALESLRDSLAELAGFATIGWFCEHENFVRTFHPRPGQALDLSDLDLIMADSLRAAASAGLSLETGGSR